MLTACQSCYCYAMANLQIKSVPDDVHAELRRRAGAEGVTLRDYVLRLILADQMFPSRQEWLTRVRARRPVPLAVNSATAIAEDRATRDAHVSSLAAESDPPRYE